MLRQEERPIPLYTSPAPHALDSIPPVPSYSPPPPPLATKAEEKVHKNKSSALDGEPGFLVNGVLLEDVVTKSTLADKNMRLQAENILHAFNINIKEDESCFTRSLPRGKWLNPDEFLLGHRNKIPELAPFDPAFNIAAKLNPFNPTVQTEVQKYAVKINDSFYGWHGSYVLNVPAGKYAKAYTANGNIPLIFGPGPHVIHDRSFRFDKERGFIAQSSPYIKHETLHILRVPAGKIAKVRLNTEPELIEGPKLCVYNSPFFELVPRSDKPNDLFHDATEQLIELDAKKRVMPYPFQVAVSYKGSILEIIYPKNEPTIITDPSHKVETFLDTQMRTLLISSKQIENVNEHDNKHVVVVSDKLTFRTKDSLEINVSLMVAFKIKDPEKVIKELKNYDEVLKHITNRAIVDMGMVIATCSQSNFLASTLTRLNKQDEGGTKNGREVIEVNYQDVVKKNLGEDLMPLGIELISLNIETPEIPNKLIKDEMQKQALATAQTNATQSNLTKNLEIATTHAEQDAATMRIKQEQVNWAKKSQAQTELEAARLRAEALIVEARAKREASELLGEQYRKYPELLHLELARLQAETFKNANLYVTPQEMRSMFATPFNLFPQTGQVRGLPAPGNRQDLPQDNKDSLPPPVPGFGHRGSS